MGDHEVRILHPFHPRCGEAFILLHRTPSCDEGHLFLQEPDGTTFSVLTKWTDLATPDPHVTVAGRRARFRLPDLVALGDILAVMKEEEAP